MAGSCVSTEFNLAIDCALAEYRPSAHDLLRVVTLRKHRSLRVKCVHKTFFTDWRVNVTYVQLYAKQTEIWNFITSKKVVLFV